MRARKRSLQLASAPPPPEPAAQPGWPWLIGVFILGLGLRLVYLQQVRHTPIVEALLGDSIFYHRWAATLAGGDPLGGKVALAGQPFFMSPGYPTALGWLYRLVGIDVVRALQVHAWVGALVPVLVMLWSTRAFGPLAGRFAGVLAAIYPPLIVYDVALLSAMSINLFNMAALALLYAVPPAGLAVIPTLAAGACVGASALCRPNVLLWGAAIGGWLLVSGGRSRGLARSALFALAIALVLTPVTLRNYRETGHATLTVASAGMNFWTGNHAGASGRYQGAEFVSSEEPVGEEAGFRAEAGRRLGHEVTSEQASRYWGGEAWRWIASNPGGWGRLLLRKAWLFWNDQEHPGNLAYDFARVFSPLIRAIPIGFAVLGTLGIAGVWLARGPRRRRDRQSLLGNWTAHAPALLLIACYAATNILFFTLAEYRMAVVPALAGFAGLALSRAWHVLRGTGSWHGLPLATGLGIVSCLVALMPGAGTDPVTSAVRNYLNAGTIYYRMHEADKAVAMCEAALRIQPNEVRAHLLRYAIEDQRGNAEGAQQALAKGERVLLDLVARAPNSARTHTDLGVVYEQQGRTAEAVVEYERALALEPGDARARSGLAGLRAAPH